MRLYYMIKMRLEITKLKFYYNKRLEDYENME